MNKWLLYFLIGAIAAGVTVPLTGTRVEWNPGSIIGVWLFYTFIVGIPVGMAYRKFIAEEEEES